MRSVIGRESYRNITAIQNLCQHTQSVLLDYCQ
jgi:hypothetical protein